MALHLAYERFIEATDLTCDCGEDVPIDDILDSASDLLTRLSGGLFRGRTTTTYRPTAGCICGVPCGHDYTIDNLDAIPLPFVQPVVTEIKVDGQAMDTNAFAIVNGNTLIKVSTDGGNTRPTAWPRRNPLWKPATAEGTWSITIEHGHYVDLTVKRAAIEVACELVRDYSGYNQLDGHVTMATLDQLTVERQLEVAEEAGFSWLARFLRMWGAAQGAEVWTPDMAGGWQFHVLA